MARQTTYIDEVQAVLDTQIADLKAKLRTAVQEQSAERSAQPNTARGKRGGAQGGALPPSATIVDDLDRRVVRLEEIRDLLRQFPEMIPVLDTVIGRRVAASVRRERIISVTVSALSVIAGWLLSIFATPTSLAVLWPF